MFQRRKFFLLTVVIILISFAWLSGYRAGLESAPKSTDNRVVETSPSVKPNFKALSTGDCQANIDIPVPDHEYSAVLWICQNKLVLDYPPTTWDLIHSSGDTTLDTVESFPSLFTVSYSNDSRHYSERIPQTVEVKESRSGTILLVQTNYVLGSASHKGAAVYLATASGARRIFQEDEDTPGNASAISIFRTDPIVIREVSNLAPLGSNGMRPWWTNLYQWDGAQEKMVLVNNRYPEVFREHLREYLMFDQKSCEETGQLLTEAYKERPNAEKVCGETDNRPYVTAKYAKIFLQAREAARRIVQGENLSDKDIESIELEL
jgi:hypothetical protein